MTNFVVCVKKKTNEKIKAEKNDYTNCKTEEIRS